MLSSFVEARRRARLLSAAGAMTLVLAACGGGGSSETTPPAPVPPTALPSVLSVDGPATHQSVGSNIEFSSNGAAGLKYQWTFGDGTTSTVAHPSHAYTTPGVYMVHVVVTNEAGSSAQADFVVRVANTAIVQDRLCTGTDGSGWCWQRPLPQGNSITDYAYAGDKNMWAVGDVGTILASSDGGATWTAQRSGTDLPMTSVRFADSKVGWATATNGTILRTIDGGAHWTLLSSGRPDASTLVAAIDSNTAAVGSNYGQATYLTRDGGVHWDAINVPGGAQRVSIVSATDIWAVAYTWTGPSLVHSTDGGTTWSDVAVPAATFSSRSFTNLRFVNSTLGWITFEESGYDSTTGWTSKTTGYRTNDGGTTWTAFDVNPFSISGYYNPTTFDFVSAEAIFAHSPYQTAIKRSVDGGVTWQDLPLPEGPFSLSGSRIFGTNIVHVQDWNGNTFVTLDAGAHWTKRTNATLSRLNSVWFFDSKEGLAIGDNGSSVRTTDSGRTWTTVEPFTYLGWRRMQFLADGSVGWVISDSGTIYRTTDRGQSWVSPVAQTSASLQGATDFHFLDANNGWAILPYTYVPGTGSAGSAVMRTTNGGTSWSAIPVNAGVNGFMSLRFADATHGVIVGVPGIALVTSDAGATWQPRPTSASAYLSRVTFIDATTAIAVGENGTVLRSTDLGQTWTRIPVPTSAQLMDVRFLSPKFGMAVGAAGTVLQTTDGGLSWSLQSTGTHGMLFSVAFVDEQTGWVAGDNGTILTTVTSGH
jgi:photosystem II stability/assembly factor-like uncharacterized protein